MTWRDAIRKVRDVDGPILGANEEYDAVPVSAVEYSLAVEDQSAVRALNAVRASVVAFQVSIDDEDWRVEHAKIASITDVVQGLIVDAHNYHELAVSAGADAERAIQACKVAEEALAESKRPFTAQMEMQNRRIIALQATIDVLRNKPLDTVKP